MKCISSWSVLLLISATAVLSLAGRSSGAESQGWRAAKGSPKLVSIQPQAATDEDATDEAAEEASKDTGEKVVAGKRNYVLPASVSQSPDMPAADMQSWNAVNGQGDPAPMVYGNDFGDFDDNQYRDPAHHVVGAAGSVASWGAQHGWVGLEYLGWFINGMEVPPLVTTSPAGTPVAQAGVIGAPGTQTIFGQNDLLTAMRSGARGKIGMWLNCAETVGIEGDYFGLAQSSLSYTAASGANGNTILARPFFDVNPANGVPRNNAELVSFPPLNGNTANTGFGAVSVTAQSRLQGAGMRLILRRCCNAWSEAGDCDTPVRYRRIQSNWTVGYRYLALAEGLQVNENLVSTDAVNGFAGQQTAIFDHFGTRNTFNGMDLGTTWQFRQNRWSFDFLGRLGLGGTQQKVRIAGATTFNPAVNGQSTYPGGLLTQTSNIGNYQRDVFSMVPEIGLTAGYQLRPRLRLTAGYTLMFWTGVARPGDQIDTSVNPNLLPPPIGGGPASPAYNNRSTTLTVQGFNVGMDTRW
jgi:hypothetical protein